MTREVGIQEHDGPIGTLVAALALVACAAWADARIGWIPGALTLSATALGAWLLSRRAVGVYPMGHSLSDLGALFEQGAERQQHARWFVHMRWIAIVASLGLILFAVPRAHLLPPQALPLLLTWWFLLVAANVAFRRWTQRGSNFERQIFVQGIVDLLVLTGFLNGSGGVENPVYFAYLFHVIIAGILLPTRKAVTLTVVAALLFSALAAAEYTRVLPHFTNELFPHEGAIAGGHSHDSETPDHMAYGAFFVLGRGIPFLVMLFLSTYLTSLIARRLRGREWQLANAGRSLFLEQQRLERVLDSTGVGMMSVGPDLTIPWATPRASRWLSLAAGDLKGRCPLYHAPGGCQECLAEATLKDGVDRENERRVRFEDGRLRYIRHATSPVRDAQGRPIQVVELLEDITDRKALEAEAVHGSKLSALGQMAAGVAHEIGNPLSSLATRLDLLERQPDPEFVQESVALLQGQIRRISRIVRGISLFSRNQKQEWSLWQLNDVVRETLEIARLDRRGQRVRLSSELARPSPVVNGVKDQITQVLLNLVLNAAEASPNGAPVKVSTKEGDGQVVLRVEDAGEGISQEHRDHLFEPFFSTKTKGTGLGLSICYSLVNAHGGSIKVDSEPGHGATFSVILPSAGQATRRPEEPT